MSPRVFYFISSHVFRKQASRVNQNKQGSCLASCGELRRAQPGVGGEKRTARLYNLIRKAFQFVKLLAMKFTT